ncbi:hypothetical protein EDB83DRAFT_1833845 [Lactarius deliciosus]|nr:hypothetical protein EDB83DRAFT_1833845 [Lactarius deliciosus]
MNTRWWASNNTELIRKERLKLLKARRDHTEEYRTGKFDQQPEGDRASPAFVPAAQLDLITLTLEILARDSVADAAESEREAFRAAYRESGVHTDEGTGEGTSPGRAAGTSASAVRVRPGGSGLDRHASGGQYRDGQACAGIRHAESWAADRRHVNPGRTSSGCNPSGTGRVDD